MNASKARLPVVGVDDEVTLEEVKEGIVPNEELRPRTS